MKNRKKYGRRIIVILSILIFSLLLWQRKLNGEMQQEIAGKVLRLHVLASSDSKEDQNRKYQVRDKVLQVLRKDLGEACSLEEAKRIVRNQEETLKSIAESISGQRATVELEKTRFPTKKYGSLTFPPGEYEALRIVLGEGKGKNWWCVLYPSLCFLDEAYESGTSQGIPPEEEKLKEALTSEEYEAIAFHKGKITIRLKLLQIVHK